MAPAANQIVNTLINRNFMDYSFDNIDSVEVLSVKGNVLTGTYNNEILHEVNERINTGHNKFVVYLGETRFINSNGLNLLINVLTKCRKAGGEVVLANIPDELNKLLVITKLNSIFIIKPTREEAISQLNGL